MTTLIIHGGCGGAPSSPAGIERHNIKEQGLKESIYAGWEILNGGGSALDAVEASVKLMEINPVFNAGIGAALNFDGDIELDASIMDGSNLNCGSVARLKGYVNAVSVARRLMQKTSHVMIVGKGACDFANKEGFELREQEEFYTDFQRAAWQKFRDGKLSDLAKHGTVGAVAIDNNLNIAAATSTGGVLGRIAGGVGDSPIIGAGTYADNFLAGASATGDGEEIIKVCLTHYAVRLIDSGKFSAQQACENAIAMLGNKIPHAQAGLIMIDHKGAWGAAANTGYLPRAYITTGHSQAIITHAA